MSYQNPRIELHDNMASMLHKMSDGNPGALTVLIRTIKEGPAIDPQCAFAEFGVMLDLDTHDIYGSRIWQLYKYVCGQDLTMMLALLRAVQLGICRDYEIFSAIGNPQKLTDERKTELLRLVKAKLVEFGR